MGKRESVGKRKRRREGDKPFNFLVLREIKEAGLILAAEVCVVCGDDERSL